MAANNTVIKWAIAGTGIDAVSAAGRLVKIDSSDTVTLAAAATETNIFGMLLTAAGNVGDRVPVAVSGLVQGAIAGGSINHGDYVTTDANGKFVVAATGNRIVGQYLASDETGGFPSVADGDELSDVNLAPVKLIVAP